MLILKSNIDIIFGKGDIMDVEKIAAASIQNLLSRNSYLQPIVIYNDKTPVWDGDIFVYKTKDRNKKNENMIGRVPVQVKGHEIKQIKDTESGVIKFRVEIADIKQYLTDGGVIYFVVYIYEDSETIFYNSLLPLDLKRLIERYKKQKSFEIRFNILPSRDQAVADIFFDFVKNREKQQGTLISDILYTNDIEKIRNKIERFNFSYSTVEPKTSIPFRELTTRDFYLYAKPKGIGNPIPFEKISNAIINIEEKLKISIDEKEYYSNAYVQWEKGKASIICGKSIKIGIDGTDDNEEGTSNFDIKLKGTLNEQLNDLYFLVALIKNEQIVINGHKITYSNFKLKDDHKYLFDRINDLELLRHRLIHYGVKNDLDIDSMTEDDDFRISFFMDEKPSTNKYKLNVTSMAILTLKIANVTILLLVEKDIKQDYYIIENYFKEVYKVKYTLPDTNKQSQISQFLALDKEMLLVDNIDTKNIMKDIKRHHSGNKKAGIVNKFLLEAIKAYDECNIQQKELSDLIYELSVWLYNETEEEYIFLNVAQVKHRLGILYENDLKKIKDISKLNEDNIEVQAATSILLNKKEEAKAIVNKMDMEEKEMFESYPIYNLL